MVHLISWEVLAEQGGAIALLNLAKSYQSGELVEKDLSKAFRLFNEVASHEDREAIAEASFHLGCCYELGEGVDQDLKKAQDYYRKAAEGGVITKWQLGSCTFSDLKREAIIRRLETVWMTTCESKGL